MTLRRIAVALSGIALTATAFVPAAASAEEQVPLTCAQGGVCQVGDIGPAGGKVIYVGETVIDAVTLISTGGRYLEAAPAGWYRGSDFQGLWCNAWQQITLGTSSTIGSGAANTAKMARKCEKTSGGRVIADLTFNGFSDWFVPSKDELALFAAAGVALKRDGECYQIGNVCYWSSSENAESPQTVVDALNKAPDGWLMGAVSKDYDKTLFRPIRAFGNPLPTTKAPTMGKPTPVKGGFTLPIRNFTSGCTWSAQVSSGRVAISSSGLITVSRLTPSEEATVTVIKKCTGRQLAWTSKMGFAKR